MIQNGKRRNTKAQKNHQAQRNMTASMTNMVRAVLQGTSLAPSPRNPPPPSKKRERNGRTGWAAETNPAPRKRNPLAHHTIQKTNPLAHHTIQKTKTEIKTRRTRNLGATSSPMSAAISHPYWLQAGLVTNLTLFCMLFTIKNHCSSSIWKVFFTIHIRLFRI